MDDRKGVAALSARLYLRKGRLLSAATCSPRRAHASAGFLETSSGTPFDLANRQAHGPLDGGRAPSARRSATGIRGSAAIRLAGRVRGRAGMASRCWAPLCGSSTFQGPIAVDDGLRSRKNDSTVPEERHIYRG